MVEINLISRYPITKRDVDGRGEQKTESDRAIARKFGKDFFDGDRKYGYGGFNYHPRFWKEVVKDFISHYCLKPGSKVLDIGCAKGFMLYDFKQALPGVEVAGIDISQYAVENAKAEIKDCVRVGDARDLSMFKDKEFDLVIAINTIHNLDEKECKKALGEIERIGKHAFLTVDAWKTDEEKIRMMNWNLTARTMKQVDDWKKFFVEAGYTGDYYWFIP